MGDVDDGKDARRERLVDCAAAAIDAGGLTAMRARPLAACAGCSVGAIYTLVADLDELVLRVNARSLAALDASLEQAAVSEGGVEEQLVAWARAYAAFAADHRNAWRALFEFRMRASSGDLPPWFAGEQVRLFGRLERRLATLMPSDTQRAIRLRARTLFSAVHGIVALGLEGKLADSAVREIEDEIVAFIGIFVAGQAGATISREYQNSTSHILD